MLLSVVLQQGPADTTSYMWLGFGIIFGVMILHVVSLYNRANRLKKDQAFLEELED